MSLELPQNFENDIQGKDTALIPVVLIGNFVGGVGWTSEYMAISTNDIQIRNDHFEPLLLNIPSLKESIDIEKRNYKISSVNLDISNFPYNGEIFSDRIGDSSLINREVRLFWASPSTKIIYPHDSVGDHEDYPHPPDPDDAFHV